MHSKAYHIARKQIQPTFGKGPMRDPDDLVAETAADVAAGEYPGGKDVESEAGDAEDVQFMSVGTGSSLNRQLQKMYKAQNDATAAAAAAATAAAAAAAAAAAPALPATPTTGPAQPPDAAAATTLPRGDTPAGSEAESSHSVTGQSYIPAHP